ncbi:hypothetical protein LMG31886_32940 [Xanthomonas hydrangeae]|nr:hypothetical protein LMG31884_33590 [Xanthomonas hydrangeae]CAD7721791.1 hypothetical protein LMG31884_33590 [Xanthomonas hydrangeae]CAD7737906.1 hypothetical protein LMG31885_27460 [Xanthomonas hydrangeae]CAD7737909.1 hypothetical protein LMG31885_27460 [Xanthomonas hydrangeae]CAD7738587.1 hypothetical protein LMG31887_33490 [Xanthomonas hydrangeae]
MSRATRRSILQQVAIFAVVGPPLGGVLGFLQWARFDSETAFLIAGLSYVLVLPVIAAAGAGLMCALMCRRLYRERGPSPFAQVVIGALSGLFSAGLVVLLTAVVGGWSMGSDRDLILALVRSGLWGGGACALLAWLFRSRLSRTTTTA